MCDFNVRLAVLSDYDQLVGELSDGLYSSLFFRSLSGVYAGHDYFIDECMTWLQRSPIPTKRGKNKRMSLLIL
jgi:hypothetical protein